MKNELNDNINFKERLKEEASNIGLNLDEATLEKFENYKNLLLEWNEKINLTAITDEYQIIMKHFIDCLEIVKYMNKDEKVIDVGTGAGFPGIVIAIYFKNEINITLLDSLNKRLIFLEDVINKLNLKNVEIVHGRAEEIAHKPEYREKYDIAVSRAVANLPTLIEYDVGYIKQNGRLLLMKGNNIENEIKEAENALKILKCKIKKIYKYSYKVGEEEYNRNIIEIIKENKIPDKYPRNYGQITKKPLI